MFLLLFFHHFPPADQFAIIGRLSTARTTDLLHLLSVAFYSFAKPQFRMIIICFQKKIRHVFILALYSFVMLNYTTTDLLHLLYGLLNLQLCQATIQNNNYLFQTKIRHDFILALYSFVMSQFQQMIIMFLEKIKTTYFLHWQSTAF